MLLALNLLREIMRQLDIPHHGQQTASLFFENIIKILRFLAICQPFGMTTLSYLDRPWKIIMTIWTLSFLLAMPWISYNKVRI